METRPCGWPTPLPGHLRFRGSEALRELFRNAGLARGPGGDRRPLAALLTCIDARVVPEVIFGTAPGRLFSVRLAGNIVTPEVLSSLEIAVDRGCPLVLVLGHTDCSAVRLERERSGDHFEITHHIQSATRMISFHADVEEAAQANVRHSVAELRARLQVPVEGGIFDVITGRVELLE
jgi:carbonic anhydrase